MLRSVHSAARRAPRVRPPPSKESAEQICSRSRDPASSRRTSAMAPIPLLCSWARAPQPADTGRQSVQRLAYALHVIELRLGGIVAPKSERNPRDKIFACVFYQNRIFPKKFLPGSLRELGVLFLPPGFFW